MVGDPYTAQSLARLAQMSAVAPEFQINRRAPGGQKTIRIAPPSENASRVMQSLMAQKTPNWGSALAKLAAVAIEAHGQKKRGAARQAAETTKREQRAQWASQLGSGASMRDLAVADPAFLADTDFQKSWAGTAPAAETERFDFADNPFGRGGHGQRSSLTNRVHDWKGPVAEAPETARKTATDKYGRLRFLDDGSPAFSDEILGPGPTPEPDVPPMKDQLAMTRQLSDDWMKTARPMQDLIAQSNRMDIGFQQAERGDMLSGSQAILISFNKLLDPGSVVRESEYARSATGQSALETLRGFVEKLGKGGAGVTLKELASYRRFGEQVVQSSLESTIGPERERIGRLAERFGVDKELIFTGRFASDAAPQQAPQAAPPETVAPMAQEQMPAAAPQLAGMLSQAASEPLVPAVASQSPDARQADPERIRHYAGLPKDALRRQAAAMAASPDKYSAAEKTAAAAAWDLAFPTGK